MVKRSGPSRAESVSWRVFKHTRDRAPHGGPLDGSAYPRPRRAGRAVPRLLPPAGLRHLPVADRRLDRLPRPAHHQRGLAGHRAGRQAAPRHRLRRVPLRRLGVGRPGDRPGHPDPHPSGPRRRRLGRRRRHPLPQARRQGRLRRHLPRRRPLVEEAQDASGSASTGSCWGSPCRSRCAPTATICLPVLWRLYRKKGQPGYQTRPQAAADAGAAAGRGQPRADVLAGRRLRLRQRGVVAGPAGEPPGDRAVALEGRPVRAARPAAPRARRGRRARRGIGCRPPRR